MRKRMNSRQRALCRGLRLLSLLTANCALLTACAANGQNPAPVVAYGLSGGAASSGMHTVEGHETVADIANRYDLSMQDIIRINNLRAPYTLKEDQRLKLPAPRAYAAKSDDTLSSVSHMFDVSPSELASLNHLKAPYTLAAGEKLRLPPPPEPQSPTLAPTPETEFSLATASNPVERPADENSVSPVSGQALTAGAVRGSPIYGGSDMEQLPSSATPSPMKVTSVQGESLAQPVLHSANVVQEEALTTPAADAMPPQPAALHTTSLAFSPPEADTPPRAGQKFGWPVSGRVASVYGDKPGGMHNDGINIVAMRGAPVHAADNGIVVYADNQLKGFGNLVLVRHADGWMTAYAHLGGIDVRRGQIVRKGERIGMVGSSGDVGAPQLHFEIRHGTEALNPEAYLEERGISAASSPVDSGAG